MDGVRAPRAGLVGPHRRRVLERLSRQAPAHLWWASDGETTTLTEGEADALLGRTIEMMGGNRSSIIYTLLRPDGGLRVIPEVEPWLRQARSTLQMLREVLLERLKASCAEASQPLEGVDSTHFL